MLVTESKVAACRRGRGLLVCVGVVLAMLCLGWFLFGLGSEPLTRATSTLIETRAADSGTSVSIREVPVEARMRRTVEDASEKKEASTALATGEHISVSDRVRESSAALENDLDRVGASFLSRDPDVSGMRAVALQCAQKAVVDESSLRTDASGTRHGSFTVPGTALQGTFQIEGDNYSIDLAVQPPTAAGAGFMAGDLYVRTIDRQGGTEVTNMAIQFHPDSSDAKCLAGVEGERIVGWVIQQNPKGTDLQPITVRRPLEGPGLIIGRAQSMSTVPLDGDWDMRANDAWLEKLRAFKPAETR